MIIVRKKILLLAIILFSLSAKAQLSGSFDTNTSYYLDDDKIKLNEIDAQNRLRSNSYLRLDYKIKKFTVGTQIESYEPKALLNYSPKLAGTNLANYYINYKNDSIGLDITAGHFYEQFGSGLVLRSWEDRQLGIANSIVGGRVKFSPIQSINFMALYGKHRDGLGFNFTDGTILGLNTDIDVSQLLKAKKIKYGFGASYVNRNEKSGFSGFSDNTYLTSTRLNFSYKGFSADVEYAFKSKDALVEFGNIRPELQFDGDAYLLNIAYTKKGFGANASLRRLENFGVYSQRNLTGNIYNRAIVNYVPALTKQYDYSLTNIYVYAAQPNIIFEPNRNKAGEVGGQLDLFYLFKKGTPLGGKFGTNISLNFSQWHGLAGRYIAAERKYKADLFGAGEKYYRETGIEIRKKWTNKWTSSFTYLNQFYNARYIEEAVGKVNANTVVVENILRFKKSKSLKFQLQHQWADALFKNWGAAQAEYNLNAPFSIFSLDLYNYGNSNTAAQIHYYNAGVAYKKNAVRFQLGYGRQRGGLVCIGGVCRFVPESTGLNFNATYGF